MLTAQAQALISRRVALAAVKDARAAWRKARETPSERYIRAAYRTCVLAARTLRRAAPAFPLEAEVMLGKAAVFDVEAGKLMAKLVRLVEGADPGPARR